MDTGKRIIDSVKERKQIEDERLKKLREAVKERAENQQKQTETTYHPS